MCLEDEYVFDVQQRGGNPFLFTIAFFRESQTQMTSVTIKTLIITQTIHAVASGGSNIDINLCFVSSMCGASVAAGYNYKLRINASIFVDVY